MKLTWQGIFTALFLFAVLALTISDNLVDECAANPHVMTGEVPPDQDTYPPTITITSPGNNTTLNTSRISLSFHVAAPQSRTASFTNVQGVNYSTDWKKESISILHGGQEHPSFDLLLSNIPEGQRSIMIEAVGYGLYKQNDVSYKWFFIRSTETIYFTVDRTAPTVTVLPPENLSSDTAVPLNLTVNEVCSKIAYSLNGEENVTVSVNSTISPLHAGHYNMTFYAWDLAGNVGTSEMASFTVTETPQPAKTTSAPSILPAIAALLVVAIIGIILLLKRRTAHQT